MQTRPNNLNSINRSPMPSDALKNGTLPAEPGIPLMVKIAGVPDQLRCCLVGVEPGVSIIVRLPVSVGESWKLSENTNCVVRYLSDGTVYGFKTYLQGKYVRDPLRFLFLAFPYDLEVHNLRGSSRIACFLPSKLDLGQSSLDGVVLDIGAGGASFEYRIPPDSGSPPALYLGMEVTLICELWGMDGEQSIACQVRNFNVDDTTLSVGMAFGEGNDTAIACIKDYVGKVQELMAEDSPSSPG